MFLYEKKIIYLAFFWDGVKKSSAGFVRISRERDACILDIHIRHVSGLSDGECPLVLVLKNRECAWGNITIRKGEVNTRRNLPVRQNMIMTGEETFEENELCGILIPIGEKKWIAGYWQEPTTFRKAEIHNHTDILCQPEIKQDLYAVDINAEEDKERRKEIVSANGGAQDLLTGRKEKMLGNPASEDKWEQLQGIYRKVHPFGDERIFLSIEPRDFVVLRAPYQRLVNNSFLLHGFYNYRHLLLGPDKEIGAIEEECFYLGVPGTYFEREKMVAVMFGFEGFECEGAVEIGKFGYYMRRVEL